jgi:hypothetical protein
MTLRMGTRQLQGFRREHPHTSALESGMTRDVGMSKRVVTSATFTASNGRITGSNGDFSAFASGDPILIQGSATNDGERIVTGIDATSHAYLVLDAAPKNEGPVSVTVRTP